MTSNGKRRPPRPSLEIVTPNAGPQEAAAIAAALERFLSDTTPAVEPQPATPGGWGRAAILEGVGLATPAPWGDGEPWR
jgi:hypothetical protein